MGSINIETNLILNYWSTYVHQLKNIIEILRVLLLSKLGDSNPNNNKRSSSHSNSFSNMQY